jgi:hypothetical protein
MRTTTPRRIPTPNLRAPAAGNPLARAARGLGEKIQSTGAQLQRAGGKIQSKLRTVGDTFQRAGSKVQRQVRDAGDKFQRATGQARRAADGLGTKLNRAISENPISAKLNTLSDAEKKFLSTNVHLAKPFADAANKADAFATQFGKQNITGKGQDIRSEGGGNAMRHAAWSALMVREAFNSPIGGGNVAAAAKKSYEFGTAHENNPLNTNKVSAGMDFHNNSVGRNAAVRVLRANPRATEADILRAVQEDFAKMKQVNANGTGLERARTSDAPAP